MCLLLLVSILAFLRIAVLSMPCRARHGGGWHVYTRINVVKYFEVVRELCFILRRYTCKYAEGGTV